MFSYVCLRIPIIETFSVLTAVSDSRITPSMVGLRDMDFMVNRKKISLSPLSKKNNLCFFSEKMYGFFMDPDTERICFWLKLGTR